MYVTCCLSSFKRRNNIFLVMLFRSAINKVVYFRTIKKNWYLNVFKCYDFTLLKALNDDKNDDSKF